MDTQLRKLFHNNGDIFDDPKARPFVRAHRNAAGTRGSLLLVNQSNPRVDLCEWISGEDADLGECKRLFRPHVPILVNAPAGVTVSCGEREASIVGSAMVLENANTTAFEASSGFRRLGPADTPLFDNIKNDYSIVDIVEQAKDLLADPFGGECFGLFEDGALAAFADIIKLQGSMFADSYLLTDIFTVQHCRKKGYAASLLKSILQVYHMKRFYYTATPATNTASVHLALQCGFTPVGEITTIEFKLKIEG